MRIQAIARIAGGYLCLGMLFTVTAAAQAPKSDQVKRGQYIVEGVGMCADCHTPFNERGEPVKEKWLQGAPVLLKPQFPVPNWAEKAPNLTDLKGWKDADLVKFLMTGVQPNGQPPNPPMPPYRMNKEDAEAVTAYIRSLSAAPVDTEAKK